MLSDLKFEETLLQSSEENPMSKDRHLAKMHDSISAYNPLAIYHEEKDDCIWLMKDDNNICYVTSGDMVYSQMYDFVLADGELFCQISDSPESRQSPTLMEISDIKPCTLTSKLLTQDQMNWLRSESIASMVKSVHSAWCE